MIHNLIQINRVSSKFPARHHKKRNHIPVSYTHLDVYKRQILFLLMGISAYLICISRNTALKRKALTVYGIQLGFNFLWSVFFFHAGFHLFAFFWLIALWILILIMIVLFGKIRPAAALFQLPYLLWTAFAGYLNIMIYLLNQGSVIAMG